MIETGDYVLFGGGYHRVLTVQPGRWDIPNVDAGDIEAINEYGDVDLFGFSDVEGVVHPHAFEGPKGLCAQCHCIAECEWHRR